MSDVEGGVRLRVYRSGVELKSDGRKRERLPGGHKAIVRPRGRGRVRRKIRAWSRASYRPDGWRAGLVRNIGAIEGNVPLSDNDWETITGGRRRSYSALDRRPDGRKVLCSIGSK